LFMSMAVRTQASIRSRTLSSMPRPLQSATSRTRAMPYSCRTKEKTDATSRPDRNETQRKGEWECKDARFLLDRTHLAQEDLDAAGARGGGLVDGGSRRVGLLG
jgi:hypothetical protein